MTPDGGVLTQLNISHIRVDDGGLYSCVAHHGDAIVSHEDRVNVYGKHIQMNSKRFIWVVYLARKGKYFSLWPLYPLKLGNVSMF